MLMEGLSIQKDVTLGRFLDAEEGEQQGRFSGSARSKNADEFIVVDR